MSLPVPLGWEGFDFTPEELAEFEAAGLLVRRDPDPRTLQEMVDDLWSAMGPN